MGNDFSKKIIFRLTSKDQLAVIEEATSKATDEKGKNGETASAPGESSG